MLNYFYGRHRSLEPSVKYTVLSNKSNSISSLSDAEDNSEVQIGASSERNYTIIFTSCGSNNSQNYRLLQNEQTIKLPYIVKIAVRYQPLILALQFLVIFWIFGSVTFQIIALQKKLYLRKCIPFNFAYLAIFILDALCTCCSKSSDKNCKACGMVGSIIIIAITITLESVFLYFQIGPIWILTEIIKCNKFL